MTEKEKMLAGMIYDANYDKDLMQERLNCKDLCSISCARPGLRNKHG